MVINATGGKYIKGKKEAAQNIDCRFHFVCVCSLLKGHQETCAFLPYVDRSCVEEEDGAIKERNEPFLGSSASHLQETQAEPQW